MPFSQNEIIPKINSPLCQGDIFKNVKYNYINDDGIEDLEIVELEFPLAIIISQACDVSYMDEIIKNNGGNSTKYMPSILMCPIYQYDLSKTGKHLSEISAKTEMHIEEDNTFTNKDKAIAEKDWHYRLHFLNVKDAHIAENSAIDFKHYFTVPASYLYKNKNNRIYRLDPLRAEKITLKFSSFLSRVGLPDNNQQ